MGNVGLDLCHDMMIGVTSEDAILKLMNWPKQGKVKHPRPPQLHTPF